MDIGSKQGYPASALSNFAPHPFVFDGIECASMEGFLQGMKFEKPHVQEVVCKLVGLAAKKRGRAKKWFKDQTLWWKGKPYHRSSIGYQQLLNNAYHAMFSQSDSFRRALAATQNAVLTHSMGKSNPNETVLTEREFIARLNWLRSLLC